MNLVIVESPTKAKTLSSFLGKEYQVEATLGHLRDLPAKKLGVNIENNFKPSYVIIPSKKQRVAEIKKIMKKASKVILATDPDREGEAIAYHAAVLLREVGPRQARSNLFRRIVFHEITKSAVQKALANPREIDIKLVEAQQARRILDRLVGYKLSPLLWKKMSRQWLSAGRVQSVAVRLIVEREREREKFKEEEYWRINGVFQKLKTQIKNKKLKEREGDILAELVAKNGERYEKVVSFNLFDGKYTVTKTSIENLASAERIINDFKNHCFEVVSVDKKEVRRFPPPPFITSTLQQEASSRLGFSSKKTMSLAQRLYEKGLITYHRTDSVFLSEKFLRAARDFIKKMHGERYMLEQPRKYKTKSKLAQEAHEAIRPTELAARGSRLEARGDLTKDHLRLYELIFNRAVASQAKEAVIDTTKIGILSDNGYLFEAKGSVVKFDGFLKILRRAQDRFLGQSREDKIVPEVMVGEKLRLVESLPTQHNTFPPPRYTEASLVKTLEKSGIGRPSTYAPTISTILARQYVEKEEGRFAPLILGETVNDFLVKNFPKIIDIPFTAEMENSLDLIAQGEKKWLPVMNDFYKPFKEQLEKVNKKAKKVALPTEETKEKCPKCGAKLVIKIGRFGKFIACSGFPECDYTAPLLEKTGINCPKCGGQVVIKKTRKGKRFYGCENWPKCKFASWKKPKKPKVST